MLTFRKWMNSRTARGEDGFSLLELVVAVGVILILTVIGMISYTGLTHNARVAAVESAAEKTYKAAMAAEAAGGAMGAFDDVENNWNASQDQTEVSINRDADGRVCVSAVFLNNDDVPDAHRGIGGACGENGENAGNGGNDGENSGDGDVQYRTEAYVSLGLNWYHSAAYIDRIDWTDGNYTYVSGTFQNGLPGMLEASGSGFVCSSSVDYCGVRVNVRNASTGAGLLGYEDEETLNAPGTNFFAFDPYEVIVIGPYGLEEQGKLLTVDEVIDHSDFPNVPSAVQLDVELYSMTGGVKTVWGTVSTEVDTDLYVHYEDFGSADDGSIERFFTLDYTADVQPSNL